jgi:amino acid permease
LGKQLNQAGALSLFLGFVYWACFSLWPLMQAVGEMCSYLPVKGTFLEYCTKWIDPALGFACTIVSLYTSMMFVCVELLGVSRVILFWIK